MRKALPLLVLMVIGCAGLGVYFANRTIAPPSDTISPSIAPDRQPTRTEAPVETEISVPVVEDNEFRMRTRKVRLSPGGDPIAKTFEALFAASDAKNSDSAIPAGTKLLSVKVKDGRAHVDLSDDFNMLNKRGDTTQSLAQQQIRAALAQFPEIKTMQVTVEGQVFEDGHTGKWTDIPVRGDVPASGGDP